MASSRGDANWLHCKYPGEPIHFLSLKVYKNVWDFLSIPGSCPVGRHNPVAAGIDVTDNCFCSVFFASLYLSSSFNKMALIFHENEVFVNCEIGCKSTCSTILLFLLGNALVKCQTLMPPISWKYQINGK